jgi:very-short-patch-repair endonuclease
MASVVSPVYLTYARLRAEGVSRALLRAHLATGRLRRVRKGRYVDAACDDTLERVASLGARLDCLSLLHRLEVFVLDHERLHVQLTRGDSRLPPRSPDVTAHWRATSAGREELYADLIEALVQAVRCQGARAAVATLDSAWHLRLIDESDLADIFARLPVRYAVLRRLLDGRAESGPETLVRLMLRAMGCRFVVQARIDGVGRVDLLVDGWLIVECDSASFHGSWADQRRDRRRDLAAAERGYATLRVTAEDIMYHPEQVRGALRGLVRSRRPRTRR